MIDKFRQNLRSSVAASAAPYGFTLTIWSSGAVSFDLLGRPRLGQVLLFMAGAVIAFLTIETAAYGSFKVRLVHARPPLIAVWGNAHFLSAGLAIVAVWGADHATKGTAGWPLAGFLATGVYLTLNALQATLATKMEDETQ